MGDTDTSTAIPYRAWAQIDLGALERNVKKVRAALPAGIQYIAVVKGDAYGHGYRYTAARLMQHGVDAFAVANVREAEALRECGRGWPIMILSPILPTEAMAAVELNAIPTISSSSEADLFSTIGRQLKRPIPVQLKIDTGMGRAGVWYPQALALARHIMHSPHLSLSGVFTHFASADVDMAFTARQRARFARVLRGLSPLPLLIHADNSPGFETFTDDPLYTAVRIGRLQFGLPPYRGTLGSRVAVEPVLSFYSRVALLKELPAGATVSYGRTRRLRRRSRIAIVAAGYADGIPTHISNVGYMIVRGQRVPVVGRVTMDMTMLDVTDAVGVSVGDRVTIIGHDDTQSISLIQLSHWAQSIPWEVVTSITQRVPRLY